MAYNKAKVRLYLLVSLLLVLLMYIPYSTYKFYEVNTYLEEEKTRIFKDLQNLQQEYAVALEEKESLKDDLTLSYGRIKNLTDSLSEFKATLTLLKYMRNELEVMREEKKQLFFLADSLDRANQILTIQRDEARYSLTQQENVNDQLRQKNSNLTQTLSKTSIIEMDPIQVSTLTYDGDSYVPTQSYEDVNKLMVCTRLMKNSFAKVGKKVLTLVIVTPEEQILGQNKSRTFKIKGSNDNRYYTAKRTVNYEGESLDVCVYATGKNYSRGVYLASMFLDRELKSEQEFILR